MIDARMMSEVTGAEHLDVMDISFSLLFFQGSSSWLQGQG